MTESYDTCELTKFTDAELVIDLVEVMSHVSDALHDSQSRSLGRVGIELRVV